MKPKTLSLRDAGTVALASQAGTNDFIFDYQRDAHSSPMHLARPVLASRRFISWSKAQVSCRCTYGMA